MNTKSVIIAAMLATALMGCNKEGDGIDAGISLSQNYTVQFTNQAKDPAAFAEFTYPASPDAIFLPSGAWVKADNTSLDRLPGATADNYGAFILTSGSSVAFTFHKNPDQQYVNVLDISDRPSLAVTIDSGDNIVDNKEYTYTFTGRPTDTYQIMLQSTVGEVRTYQAHLTTDGKFKFNGAPVGTYNLLLVAERHAPLQQTDGNGSGRMTLRNVDSRNVTLTAN